MVALQIREDNRLIGEGELLPDPLLSAAVLHGRQAREEPGEHRTLPGRIDGELENGITPDATEARHNLHLNLRLL